MAANLFCGYAGDGATIRHNSRDCLHQPWAGSPGCIDAGPGCHRSGTPIWCDDDACNLAAGTCKSQAKRNIVECAWRPEDLATLLLQHKLSAHAYNEMVISAEAWVQHIPWTIEAFFYPAQRQ